MQSKRTRIPEPDLQNVLRSSYNKISYDYRKTMYVKPQLRITIIVIS